jgi:hypothetical protein
MPYVLFAITPGHGEKAISQNKYSTFDQAIGNLSLLSEYSTLLGRGAWLLDLTKDAPQFHELISAALEAKISFRYMLLTDQIAWITS